MKTAPGPGFYDPEKPKLNIKYSMSVRLDGSNSRYSKSMKQTPGPGSYSDPRAAHYGSIPGSKMGRDTRKQQFLKTPSYGKQDPGSYKINGFANNPATGVPRYGFGTSTRPPLKKDSQPGPGSYEYIAHI